MSMKIRFAEKEDRKVMLDLIKKHGEFANLVHKVTIDEKKLVKAFFEDKLASALLVEDDGYPVGICIFYRNFCSITGEAGYFVEDLYIDVEKRDFGYGKALFKYVLDMANREGINKIDWYCLKDNEKAIGLYKDLGAVIEEDVVVFTLEN